MTNKSSKDVASQIRKKLLTVTEEQSRLLKFLGVNVDKSLPHLVIAAKLKDRLAASLAFPQPTVPGGGELARIKYLKEEKDGDIEPVTNTEAEAWVTHLRLLRRAENLDRTTVESGDVVEISIEGRFAEVSSIGDDGRVYLKGGRGAGTWPDLIEVCARRGDESAEAEGFRIKARNYAAESRTLGVWTEAKNKELMDYEVTCRITDSDIDQLEHVICTSEDERPIQKYLENNPQLLASLLGGKNRFCIPQKRLGAEYIPDFLIADTDSLGIYWTLIELETPNTKIYSQKTDQLDRHARTGVAQVQEWREWLTANIAYARQKRKENGLGLIDIRPGSRAIVLVGRRTLLRETKEIARNQLRDNENIHVHTYDWLLEHLRGSLKFAGVPAANPYYLQPEEQA